MVTKSSSTLDNDVNGPPFHPSATNASILKKIEGEPKLHIDNEIKSSITEENEPTSLETRDSGFIDDETPSAIFAKNRTFLANYLSQTRELLEAILCPPAPLYIPYHFNHVTSNSLLTSTSIFAIPPYCSIPLHLAFPIQESKGSTSIDADEKSILYSHECRVLNVIDENVLAASNSASNILNASAPMHSAQLLSKIALASSHLDKLQKRIMDKKSHVLVTGDLNAGKSTFVNTLLRKSIVPEDQQPCTALFVQVSDPQCTTDGEDQVHGVFDPSKYDPNISETYTRHDMSELRHIVEENIQGYSLLNVYCRDDREQSSSLLHNGLVDISLIDSPGLNIDSITTTSLFSKQEEIDVIVFVVNAENHFTLSAKQFLKTATEEKAYVFIVVNKFDNIRRKDRCRKDILDQLKSISEDTYSHADSLVHFVSARSVTNRNEDGDIIDGSNKQDSVSADGYDWVKCFDNLEESLRSFILEKRLKSKLTPAKTYLSNLLSDLILVAEYNTSILDTQLEKASSTVEQNRPILNRMLNFKSNVLDRFDSVIEEASHEIEMYTRQKLVSFLADIDRFSLLVPYDGLLETWSYAHKLKRNILALGEKRFQDALDFAQERSVDRTQLLSSRAQEILSGEHILPVDTTPLVVGFQQLKESQDTFLSELFDLIDVSDKLGVFRDLWPGLSLAIGGLIGYQGFLSFNSFRFLSSSSPLSRLSRLGFAGLVVTGTGLMLYALSDISHSIRKRVVSSIVEHVKSVGFVDKNATLVAKRSRGYLYHFAGDYRERFQRILDEQQNTFRISETRQEELNACHAFFQRLRNQSTSLHKNVQALQLDVD